MFVDMTLRFFNFAMFTSCGSLGMQKERKKTRTSQPGSLQNVTYN